MQALLTARAYTYEPGRYSYPQNRLRQQLMLMDTKIYHRSDPSSITEDTKTSDYRTQRIRAKNRRQMFLQRHPSYFDSPELELADPLLYDRCVRRFQSAAEREADGRSKGYSGVLEADLYRSEAKISAVAGIRDKDAKPRLSPSLYGKYVTYVRGPDGEVLPEDPDEIPKSKDEGMERWRYEMTMRFIRGEDNEFSYGEIDESDTWDTIESREEEDKWFDDEEPSLTDRDGDKSGETGIQDF